MNDRLHAAGTTRINQYVVVVQARAGVRVAEFLTEREIRSFAGTLQAAEGGRRGPAFHGIFTDGLNAAITPRRRNQARELRKLIGRLNGSTVPAAVALAAEWAPRLTAAADRFEAALDAFDTASAAHDQAFRTELNCRAEHSRSVDELVGRVRALFPEDRPQQDAVFPLASATPARTDGETEAETGEPPAVPEPAPTTAPMTTPPA